jgi:predicted ABC-type transport system involved in lysophospholipase L1 biosynthesis ATPase subunit
MIYAIVGIPGAGKSFLAVKTMLDYIASGGVCVSNIKFTGLEDSGESGFFRWKVLPESPVVKYLKSVLK